MHKPSTLSAHGAALQARLAQLAKRDKTPMERPTDALRVRMFCAAHGIEPDDALIEWFCLCNGWRLRHGTLLGIETGSAYTDIAAYWELYPTWLHQRWLPLANDGFGNVDVLLLDRGAVCFIDVNVDPAKPAYITASSLAYYMQFFLDRELGIEGWPFDGDYVSGEDVEIYNFSDLPLPWST